jgi:2-polyprenyl-6-methoxyphenol hydroxylase-like FAD-dependent oxidoreductase
MKHGDLAKGRARLARVLLTPAIPTQFNIACVPSKLPRPLGMDHGVVHIGYMVGKLDIAIAGAGVGGLASGSLLARLGHRVTVFERFKESKPLGSGLMIQPTGLAALDILGARQPLENLGARLSRLYGSTATGTTIFDVAYEDLSPGLYALGVHRAALHAVLWDVFSASGAGFEGGCAIGDASHASNGRVSVIGDQGRDFGQFDLLIDTTGARSNLRTLVDTKPAQPFAYGALWASVRPAQLDLHALSQRYVRASVMVGHLPAGQITHDGPQLAAFFWSLKTKDIPAWRSNFERWRDAVVALWPEMEQIVAGFNSPDDLLPAQYHHFTAKVPYKNGVVLVGDSAHATSPQLGQGANNAMLDACALAAGLVHGRTIEEALALYASSRRPHVRFYQLASALMTPIFQSDSVVLPWGRDLIFNRLKIVPWLRKEMVRTLSGLKTGPFTSSSAPELASADRLALITAEVG